MTSTKVCNTNKILFTIGYRNKDSRLLSSKLDWTVVKVGENIWRVDQEISKTLNSCWSHDWMFVSKVSKTVKTYQGQRKMSLNNLDWDTSCHHDLVCKFLNQVISSCFFSCGPNQNIHTDCVSKNVKLECVKPSFAIFSIILFNSIGGFLTFTKLNSSTVKHFLDIHLNFIDKERCKICLRLEKFS